MSKLLGCVLIFAAGGWIWRMQIAELRRRVRLLEELISALSEMAEEIRMARTPLPLLLDALQRRRPGAAPLFRAAAAAARKGENVAEAWRQAADQLPLLEGERAALAEAGGCLAGDEGRIVQGLSLAEARLTRSLEETQRQRPERERRTTALSFSAAALLVILLI